MSDRLKQKCDALAAALYDVLMEMNVSAANAKVEAALEDFNKKNQESTEEKKKPGRPPKAKTEEPKAAEPAPAAEPVNTVAAAPEPVVEPAKEETLDDLFEEAEAPVQAAKTVDDVKNYLMDWTKQDLDKRKPKAIILFKEATGLDSFKLLTEENATEMFYKLETRLKNFK